VGDLREMIAALLWFVRIRRRVRWPH